jgi:uncharacterized protein (DUF58 family)
MPAGRAFVAVAIATLLLAFAAVEPAMGAAAVGLDALVVVACAIDHRRARRSSLHAVRVWPPLLVQGAAGTVEVRLHCSRRLTVHLREALDPALATAPLHARLTVPAGASAWRYEVRPRRRGEHPAGPLTARVLGPWGLAWAQRELVAAGPMRIYPQVRWEGRTGRLLRLAQLRQLGQSPLATQGLGTEPYALRDYRQGDPPTRIHWKATARHGRLIAREEAWERGARLVVLLDCARAMASREGARSKLDHALAAALALARVAVSRGDRVTLVAFSDRVDRVVRVRPGGGGVARAYDALFDVDARLCEPAYDLAAEAACAIEPRRATVALLSSLADLGAAVALNEALLSLRRHRTLLVNLEDPELFRLAMGSPADAPEAFAKASALEILLANRRLGRRLARSGLRVVGAPADRLAAETLDAYLALLGARPAGRRASARPA